MALSVAPRVTGGQEVLDVLKEIDPKLRRATNRTIKQAASPLVAAVRERLPDSPLSNWVTGRYAYDQARAARGVQVKIGGRAGRNSETVIAGRASSSWPLIAVVQNNAGGSVFDMAGRRSSGNTPQGQAFIRGLNAIASSSRSMWPAAEGTIDAVRETVLAAVNDVADDINRSLRNRT
jgi:hypothetical protein